MAVLDLLLRELDPVVPMAVAEMLSDDRVSLHREVFVHFRHVHVVDKVNQLLAARWTIHFAGLFLQRLLQHFLWAEGVE